MCQILRLPGQEFETVGELRKICPVIAIDPVYGKEPKDGDCLCAVDIVKTCELVGLNPVKNNGDFLIETVPVRVVFSNGSCTYSYYDYITFENPIEVGEWVAPFPNKKNNSTAFGLVETFLQSDYCPPVFRSEKPTSVRVVVRRNNE